MTRRQRIEQIIIGSLLTDFDTYQQDAIGIITPDMFDDEAYQRAFALMEEQHGGGQTPDLLTVCTRMMDDAYHLVEASIDGDFNTLKASYNIIQRVTGQGKLTNVTFEEYITKFMELYEQDTH